MSWRLHRSVVCGTALLLAAAAVALSGCNGATSGLGLLFILAALGLVQACTSRNADPEAGDPHRDAGDAGHRDAGTTPPVPEAGMGGSSGRPPRAGRAAIDDDDAGQYEGCCVDGIWKQCWCDLPPGNCNFGIDGSHRCDDGTCREDVDDPCSDVTQCLAVDDPGEALQHTLPREGGLSADWEPCCVGGEVRSCFEPPGLECGYGTGWFENADGSCAYEADLDGGL